MGVADDRVRRHELLHHLTMTYDPVDTDDDGTVEADVDNESTSTDDLDIDGSDLVQNGDFLPLYSHNPQSSTSQSFTSTSYTNSNPLSNTVLRWDNLFPTGVNAGVFGQILVVPGTGETISVRLRNTTDSETVNEVTGISSRQVVSSGPTDYAPNTTGSELQIRWEWKTDTGSNSTQVFTPHITYGVLL